MFKPIIIEEALVNYIEGLDYEYQSRRELIVFMLTSNMNIETIAFQKYQKEMTDYYIKFNIAKEELEKKYIRPIINNKNVSWQLDYTTNTIKIEEILE